MNYSLTLAIVAFLMIVHTNSTSPKTEHLFLRHEIFSSLGSLTGGSTSTITPSNAMSTLQTCKNVGSTWDSVTNKVTGVTGTWNGSECDNLCTAQKGIVCGAMLKDCCAMACQGTFYKTCKFDLKLTRAMMKCGA